MQFLDNIARRFPAPRLTKTRIILALAVALAVDSIQIALGPVGWVAPDEVLDVIACILICWLLGFHVLLLPTFLLELVPIVDMLPTWTGCVALVIGLRRRTGGNSAIPAQTTTAAPPVHPISPPPPMLPPPPGPGAP